MSEITVRIRPHDKQADFIYSPAKRKVVVFGRRAGKTYGFAMLAVDRMLQGGRVLYACPKQDQTEHFWRYCKELLAELIDSKVIYKNETHRQLEMPGAGSIRAKTAHDADTLRGDYADLLLLDEYQNMNPDAWEYVGSPMLIDNDGDAVFGGTPMRRNHFFHIYQRAKSSDGDRWAAWHFPSTVNPHLSSAALEELASDMTDEAYRQEILAEFLEGEGQVFRNIDACMGAPMSSDPKDHAGHRIVSGGDWGKQHDFSAFSVGCADCRIELDRDRFNKIDYIFQRGRLKVVYDRWGRHGFLPERNSIGEPNIEQLVDEGFLVLKGEDGKLGFNTSASTKPRLIENLALVLERAEWQFQDDDIWTSELEAYERKVSPTTGRSSYSAPEGMHDDTVMARALMVWAGQSHTNLEEQPEHRSRFDLEGLGVERSWKKF